MLIGLVGRSRVGKDTVAQMFSDKYKIKRLAQPVKDACKVLYGWDDFILESDIKEMTDEKWGVSPRTAMVNLTNSIKKLNGPDFFVRRFFETWDGTPTIIPDVRYPSDVTEIHSRGGITIKIERHEGPRHEFENEIDDITTTYVVHNNGNVSELLSAVTGLRLASLQTPGN
jgi:hypothetical protein